MRDPRDLRGGTSAPPEFRVSQEEPCSAELYRFLYREVGRRYHWVDRLEWTDEQIAEHLGRGNVTIWVLRHGHEPAGYFELVGHDDGSVEIAYFGLLQDFLGRGLGKYLLAAATRQAWQVGANRVWLHTCTLDHPAALPNYLARGFREFKKETYTVET
ncbi:MAG: GNAT family N-acetyltransferase [Gemmatimonadetes bacterium]|nr:GNAT family N-acetyltransferase [Gemmatimonadota bacterium]